MQITSDNVQGSAPFPAALVGEQTKFTGSKEPMPLSNQALEAALAERETARIRRLLYWAWSAR